MSQIFCAKKHEKNANPTKINRCCISFLNIIVGLSALAVGWQTWRIWTLRKEMKTYLIEEFKQQSNQTFLKVVGLNETTIKGFILQHITMCKHIYALAIRLKDYDFAILSISSAIQFCIEANVEQEVFSDTIVLSSIVEVLSLEKIELSASTIDEFLKALHLAEAKGYTSETIQSLKQLIYKKINSV